MSDTITLPDLSDWQEAPEGHVIQEGEPWASHCNGSVAYHPRSKVTLRVEGLPDTQVFIPPKRLPKAPGSLIRATLGAGVGRVLFRCADEEAAWEGAVWWDAHGGGYDPSDFDAWELIHDEGARQ